jgi:metal-responsive CopG/Arc/MetJ family transcriptional regulator
MTTTNNYKKELYSLPVKIVDELVEFAKETKQKKSHIVAVALQEYMQKREDKKRIQDALSLIGMISENSPNIQEIKANRYDI